MMVNTTRAAAVLAMLALAGCDRGAQPAQQAQTTTVAAAPTSTGLSGPEAAQQACDTYHAQQKIASGAWNAWNKAVPKGTEVDANDDTEKAVSDAAEKIDGAAGKLQAKLDELGAKLNDNLTRNLTTFVTTIKKAAADLRAHARRTDLNEDASYLEGASQGARAVCGIK